MWKCLLLHSYCIYVLLLLPQYALHLSHLHKAESLLLQVINKQNDTCFTSNDEKVFSSYLQFCGIGLRNAQLYEKSQLEVKRNQVLLDLARMIFEEQSTIEHMVLRILTHTQSLIQCQRVQVCAQFMKEMFHISKKSVDPSVSLFQVHCSSSAI